MCGLQWARCQLQPVPQMLRKDNRLQLGIMRSDSFGHRISAFGSSLMTSQISTPPRRFPWLVNAVPQLTARLQLARRLVRLIPLVPCLPLSVAPPKMARAKVHMPRRCAIVKPGIVGNGGTGTASMAARSRSAAAAARRIASAVPTHVYTSSTGVRAEVLRLAPPHAVGVSAVDSVHTHVVMLPGNPGLIEFYRRYMHEIVQRLPLDVRKATTVHGLGLPGHDVRELNGRNKYLIEDHVAYIRDYLASAQVSPPIVGLPESKETTRIIFMGHSYGSYLAMRVLAEESQVASHAHLVMLMPAVVELASCMPVTVRMFTNATVERMMVPFVSGVSRVLPSAALQRLTAAARFEAGAEAVLARMMDGRRAELYRNCLGLARDEADNIRAPKPGVLMGEGDRAFLYWTDNDAWCTECSVSVIREAFGEGLTVQKAGEAEKLKVDHAFCTNSAQTDAVAAAVVGWIIGICRRQGTNVERYRRRF
jgi:pimeloyl-ACP methyl ester carboxylesterase